MNFYRDQQVPTHTAGTASGTLINSTTVAVGDTSVAVDTGTGTFTVGDIFTVAGDTQTYTVTTAVADVSAGTLAFSPPAKVAWANNAAVTRKASHVVNLAFDSKAFALALRAPADGIPGLMESSNTMTMTEPKSGIPLKVSLLGGYHAAQVELSLLRGAECIDPRRACRIAG